MRRPLLLALMLPVLLASKCGRKVDDDDKTEKEVLPTPDVALQVAGIDPSFMPADAGFSAEVFGNGFERGAVSNVAGSPVDTRFRDDSTLAVSIPALAPGSYDVQVVNPDGIKSTLRKALTITSAASDDRCRAITVRFGFDSSVLDAATRGEVEAAAACLRNSTDFVRVEGHCDDRGTTDYNVALGQRRADAVARFVIGLGVSPSRVQAVSYGEERPANPGSDESARSANRRVEIIPGGGR